MTKSLLPVDQMVPGANLPAYFQAISSIPILSAERERELAEELYYNSNLAAARELVMSHLRFVYISPAAIPGTAWPKRTWYRKAMLA